MRLEDVLRGERLAGRFWPKVAKDGPIVREELGACWEWKATRLPPYGYGLINVALKSGKRRPQRAHRIAFMLEYGEVRDDRLICHHCDRPSCVRPSHLFEGDHLANIRDMYDKGRNPRPDARGDKAPNARLTWEAVFEIRRRHAMGETWMQLGSAFGVSDTAIGNIVRRRSWTGM